ncbi:hypothetical protein [Sphingobacterium sp. UBA6320]|uniref:hypothetical protein n=1 Tax=Sphingobacterium sp. UBA6320 TaxID=1947510 RepID=UPI0025E98346|nr:hypothetical protein [Sphingobacterium sp. UBA6320]
MEENKEIKIHKRLFLIVGILLLINPVIIYLVSSSIWLSLTIPILAILFTAYINQSKRFNLLSTISLNVILVLSFLLHAEVIFTYKFSDYIIEDLYNVKQNYYFNRPYLNKTFQDKEFLVRYKTNAQGFRIGEEDDPETRVEKCDWLFIGDSYTQGAQVEYEELYTSELFNHYPNKIIVNAGISGLGIIDEYYYYINEGKNLKADKVFLQICNFNDFMKVDKRTSGFSDYFMHYSNFARFILYDFKYANPAELPLGRWTEPFYPDQKSNRDFNIFYKEQSDKKLKDLENFHLYLNKFAKAVKDNGAELVILQIPTKEQVSFKYLNEVLNGFDIDIDDLDMQFPNSWLSSLCKQNKIEHIDLLDDFANSGISLFFDFDEHLNIAGHQQVSTSISKFLNEDTPKMSIEVLSKLNVGDRYPIFGINDNNIFFQSWRDGNMELFVADSNLLENRRITWNKTEELHPWPSPNGDQIVFTEGDQSLNNTKIVIMNSDGSNRKYLTDDISSFGAIPSYNHNGDKIAYAAWYHIDGKYTNPYIIIHNLLNNEKTIITSDEFENWRPIFSPDEKKLYYIAKDKNDQFDIYQYSFENKKTTNLTKSDYDEWDPCISRDGTKMVFAARKKDNWDLFLLDLQSGKTNQLTDSKGNEWDPNFSPTGDHIYYAATYGLRNGIFKIFLN